MGSLDCPRIASSEARSAPDSPSPPATRCGYWWGSRLTELGRTEPPTSLWVSIGLAALFLGIGLVQVRRRASRIETVADGSGRDTEPYRRRIAERLAPWRWSAARLLGFALLNATAAAGIAAGFSPRARG